MPALWRVRVGWGGLLRPQPQSPVGKEVTDSQCVSVCADTHTQVRQLCLYRAPLSVTFFAEVLAGSLRPS